MNSWIKFFVVSVVFVLGIIYFTEDSFAVTDLDCVFPNGPVLSSGPEKLPSVGDTLVVGVQLINYCGNSMGMAGKTLSVEFTVGGNTSFFNQPASQTITYNLAANQTGGWHYFTTTIKIGDTCSTSQA